MLDIDINIELFDKRDINIIKDILIEQKIDSPICIIEYPDSFLIKINSSYEEYEIDKTIQESFEEYEFTEYLGNGMEEIRISIQRIQNSSSTDGWGRGLNYDNIETKKYLVRKGSNRIKNLKPSQRLKVLFCDVEKEYMIGISKGVNKVTNEKGFVIIDSKKTNSDEPEMLKNKLFKTYIDAFWGGYYLKNENIEKDFREFKIRNKRKKNRK